MPPPDFKKCLKAEARAIPGPHLSHHVLAATLGISLRSAGRPLRQLAFLAIVNLTT
jgi:hypothetical protein